MPKRPRPEPQPIGAIIAAIERRARQAPAEAEARRPVEVVIAYRPRRCRRHKESPQQLMLPFREAGDP